MSLIKVYHNSRCSKSNQALAYLKDKGINDEQMNVVRYLDEPISKDVATELVNLLQDDLEALIRRADAKKLGIDVPKSLTKDWVIEHIVSEPKIMQRPIVVKDKKAIVARPTELIDSIL